MVIQQQKNEGALFKGVPLRKKPPLWISLCIVLLLFAWPALAQTPTPPPTPREALIEVIQQRAQQDATSGRAQASIGDLHLLFGTQANAVGLPLLEVQQAYDTAYAAAVSPEPWWEPLRPLITGAGLLALAYFVFDKLLKDYIAKFLQWLGKRIYLQIAGFRPFWGLALKRYRRALDTRYERLNIPFRPGRPLEMREVYVPLKVSGAQTTDLIDTYRAVAEHKWLMITGAPGAGKTMLLRHLALHYTEGGLADFPTQPVPVLLELNRLSDSQEPLETHLAQALKANDFPGGERFIAAGLEHGLLLLLFDGLDEVAREARPHAVQQIKDMLQAHPKVRAIITCRTAVYDGEFDTLVQQRLEIAEFSDQQIQRFLSSWQAQMPPGKSPEHLLRNLRERPHIMGLARNPLLLTIIAYLYTDTPFVLPHSRTAFYDKALAVLLEQWDAVRGTPNRYTVDEKRLVLQHLALHFQDHAARGGGDRRSVDLPTVLTEIARVLPALSRKAEDARPLLDEIVARSGLLLVLDGGLRYQFAHLTLQEFFTAQKLQDDTIGLLERFRADPGAWRETLKLWCGLPHDSTALIRALYAEHSILAFECLGDAQQVNEGLAQEIITAFQTRLGEDGAEGVDATITFAAVATTPLRGKGIFDFLTATVKDFSVKPARRSAAAIALAWSNLPEAAKVLAECALDHPEVCSLLTHMGDLATPIIAEQAKHGYKWAVDALQSIGTPAAAYALTDLLWEDNDILALFPPTKPWGDQYFPYRAAWHLAILMANPIIENALREYPLTESQRRFDHLDWIWEPFESDAHSPLRIVTGRIAHLIYTIPPDYQPDLRRTPDPRILLPLCTVAAARDKKVMPPDSPERTRLLAEFEFQKPNEEEFQSWITEARGKFSKDLPWSRLFACLPDAVQLEWLRRLVWGVRLPDKEDWRNLLYLSEFDFSKSWHRRDLVILLGFILVLTWVQLGQMILSTSQPWNWSNGLAVVLGLAPLGIAVWLDHKWGRFLFSLEQFEGFLLLMLLFCFGPALGALAGSLSGNWVDGVIVGMVVGAVGGAVGGVAGGSAGTADDVVGGLVLRAGLGAVGGAVIGAAAGMVSGAMGSATFGVMSGGLVSLVVIMVSGALVGADRDEVAGIAVNSLAVGMVGYGPSALVYGLGGLLGLVAFWGLWLALALGVYWDAKRRERAAANPLHGLLDGFGPAPATPQRRGGVSFLPLGLFSRHSRSELGRR